MFISLFFDDVNQLSNKQCRTSVFGPEITSSCLDNIMHDYNRSEEIPHQYQLMKVYIQKSYCVLAVFSIKVKRS